MATDTALDNVNSMVSGLNQSIDAAIKRLTEQRQQRGPTGAVEEFEKTVRKSSLKQPGFATDIGILAKDRTRLNVASALSKADPADFYKFRVTSKGEATLGQIGDDGVRVQLMTPLGTVVADSNKDSEGYAAYKKLQTGDFTLERGTYTLRIARDQGATKGDKNYALQLSMGGYGQDYDTIAKQPKSGDSPFQLSAAQQGTLDALNAGLASLQAIPTGQSATDKLLGSLNILV